MHMLYIVETISVAILTESLLTADEDNEQNAAPMNLFCGCYAIHIPFKFWLGQ